MEPRILLIDNMDSFVYNIVHRLAEIGVGDVRVARTNEITLLQIQQMQPTHIIISPGPCTPREAGISTEVIKQFYRTTPILGICLGHQCIGDVFGASIVPYVPPVHGKASVIHHFGDDLFRGCPKSFLAGRYHSLIIRKNTLPPQFIVTATTEDGIIMGIRHREFPLFGMQFHPESIMTLDGKKILSNFISESSPWLYKNGNLVKAIPKRLYSICSSKSRVGVYETVLVKEGAAIFLSSHLSRLAGSAKLQQIPLPVSLSIVKRLVDQLILLNKVTYAKLQIIITPTLFQIQTLAVERGVAKDISVILSERMRPNARSKHLDVSMSIQALSKATKLGFRDAIFFLDGYVLEGTFSTVVVMKGRELITPSKNVLKGITVSKLFSLLRSPWRCRFGLVSLRDLLHADEVFLISAIRGIVTVKTILYNNSRFHFSTKRSRMLQSKVKF